MACCIAAKLRRIAPVHCVHKGLKPPDYKYLIQISAEVRCCTPSPSAPAQSHAAAPTGQGLRAVEGAPGAVPESEAGCVMTNPTRPWDCRMLPQACQAYLAAGRLPQDAHQLATSGLTICPTMRCEFKLAASKPACILLRKSGIMPGRRGLARHPES